MQNQRPKGDNCKAIPPHVPPGTPSDVWSWLLSPAANSEFKSNPKTIEVPPNVYSWYTATASAFYSDCPSLPAVVETGAVTPSAPDPPITADAAGTPNSTSTDSTPTDTPVSPPSHDGSAPASTSENATPKPSDTSSAVNSRAKTSTTGSSRSMDSELPLSTSLVPDPNSSPATPLPLASSGVPPQAPITATSTHHRSNKTAGIVAGILVPLFLLALCATVFIIHKRRRRARDRREWERTHAEIADAVREMHGEVPSAVAPWSMARVDVKAPPDYGGGEKAALFDKHGGEVLSSRSSTSI